MTLDAFGHNEYEAHRITLEELLPPRLNFNLHMLVFSAPGIQKIGRKESNQTTPNVGHATKKPVLVSSKHLCQS